MGGPASTAENAIEKNCLEGKARKQYTMATKNEPAAGPNRKKEEQSGKKKGQGTRRKGGGQGNIGRRREVTLKKKKKAKIRKTASGKDGRGDDTRGKGENARSLRSKRNAKPWLEIQRKVFGNPTIPKTCGRVAWGKLGVRTRKQKRKCWGCVVGRKKKAGTDFTKDQTPQKS